MTLQVVASRGFVVGVPSSVNGWRLKWFYISTNGERGVGTTWKVPTMLVEPRLEVEAENRVKRVKEWREKEGVKWDDLIRPSTCSP